jgi:hypothetical protein
MACRPPLSVYAQRWISREKRKHLDKPDDEELRRNGDEQEAHPEPRVNVLALNLALDEKYSKSSARLRLQDQAP